MKKFILLFVLFFSSLYANFYDTAEQKNELSFLNSFEISESFLHNDDLQDLKSRYKEYQQKRLLDILNDANIYYPLVSDILIKEGVPKELIYMAMAESSFNNRAYSKAKAVGMWQFMEATAKIYGLRVDEYVDERRDPIKSTYAATKYLKDLKSRLGKWYLAIMAYNCGEGRVRSAINKAGTDDIEVLLSIKKRIRKQYLPRETRDYIRKILALASVAENDKIHSINGTGHLLNMGTAYPLVSVLVASGTTLNEIAKASKTDLETIRQFNVSLKYGFVPPDVDSYEIYIPYDKLAPFKLNYAPKAQDKKFIVYEVTKGDSLFTIGKKYNIPYGVIKDFNNLKSNMLAINQKLVIPILKDDKEKVVTYTVKDGDTLYSIAKKFSVNIDDLINENKITKEYIYAGDKLVISK